MIGVAAVAATHTQLDQANSRYQGARQCTSKS